MKRTWLSGGRQGCFVEPLETRRLLALLGVVPDFPAIVYDAGGQVEYVASSERFTLEATPLAIRPSDSEPPILITGGSRLLRIELQVDHDGNLLRGVSGDNLTVVGDIDIDGDGTNEHSGILLEGEVLDFGFLDVGNTDQFDFRIRPTGGQLLDLFGTPDVAVTTTSENSTFTGSFRGDFGGGAKGNLGAVDPLAEVELKTAVNGLDTDLGSGPLLPVPSPVTFSYSVSNKGNVPLADLTIDDDHGTPNDPSDDFTLSIANLISGDTDGDELLDIDESWLFEISETVTPGQFTSIARVTAMATTEEGQPIVGLAPVTDTDTNSYIGATGHVLPETDDPPKIPPDVSVPSPVDPDPNQPRPDQITITSVFDVFDNIAVRGGKIPPPPDSEVTVYKPIVDLADRILSHDELNKMLLDLVSSGAPDIIDFDPGEDPIRRPEHDDEIPAVPQRSTPPHGRKTKVHIRRSAG